MIVGTEHPDDAAVLRLPGGDLLVQTADVIAPLLETPFELGRIAAANALSDVYAMGGDPLSALALVFWPKEFPPAALREAMQGVEQVLGEAGCILVGGHTVVDPRPKLGLAVTGLVQPSSLLRLDAAREGDVLLLTKPLGAGVVNQALRRGRLDPELLALATDCLTTLNALPSRAARAAGARAATDITGFGLGGHAAQLARASGVTCQLWLSSLPTLPGVTGLIEDGLFVGRADDNAKAWEAESAPLEESARRLLFDPQTSGGLLVALPEESVPAFEAALEGWPWGCHRVGRVVAQEALALRVR